SPNPMRRVVRLKGRILQVREVDRGDPVGYGAEHVMDHPGRLATVAIGYADGWLRSLSHKGSGRLGGTRVPLIGRVSMDLVVFAGLAVATAFTPLFHLRVILTQMVNIGYFSLPVVGLTAVFTGMVLALQSHTGFSRFAAEGAVATVVVLSITRELGPVITG